jgi:2-desacetyl-2-hydroxyethyl bacteriochlorophyllide A dehydrogenase
MRAAVIEQPRAAALHQATIADPAEGQVRVRIEGCGVCGSNLAVWEGQPWFRYPLAAGAPGHEGWGRIDAIGDGVTGLQEGQRIAMLSSHAFAEFDLADASHVVPVPAALDGRAIPAEAVACAVNVFRRSAIAPGSTVAIVGAGFLGLVLVQLAARAGAHVIALSRRPWARELASACGADTTVPTDPRPVAVSTVAHLMGPRGCDVVIEAIGSQAALDLSTDLTREGGRLIVAGYHQDGPRTVDMQTWNWRGLDVINAHERDPRAYVAGMRAGLDAIAAGEIDLDVLCTHAFALDQLGDALEMLRTRPDGFLKAVVKP